MPIALARPRAITLRSPVIVKANIGVPARVTVAVEGRHCDVLDKATRLVLNWTASLEKYSVRRPAPRWAAVVAVTGSATPRVSDASIEWTAATL